MELGLGSFTKFYALLLLGKKERSGYELMREIGNAMGKRPSAGQIYPLLAKMRAAGLLKMERRGAREKKTYSLTPRGREAVGKMLGKTDAMIGMMVADKLRGCERCGCMVYEKGYEKKIRGKNHYFCCASCAAHKIKCR